MQITLNKTSLWFVPHKQTQMRPVMELKSFHYQMQKQLKPSELTDSISSRSFYDPISFDSLSPMRSNARYKRINELKLVNLAKDLRINNCRKSMFDKFWDVCSNVIDDMTGCDDLRHSSSSNETGEVIVNMAVAISAPDLYEKCCQQAMKDNIAADIYHPSAGLNLNFSQKMP